MTRLYEVPAGSTVVEVLTDGKLDLVKNVEYMYGLSAAAGGKWEKNPPKNWEDAARRGVYKILSHSFRTWDRVSDLREHIDYMIDEMGPESEKNISNSVAAEYWTLLGCVAGNVAAKLNYLPDLDKNESELSGLVDEISRILVRKQRDYGHTNIARFGRAGLLVRCHDKVARLENLTQPGKTPENETVVDNFIDVIGYAAIGIMWENGWFLLELPALES